jgi:sucrose-6-phosphate hydrolase SacC (GH32 family)
MQDTVRHVEILLDRGSIETFVNHGEISSTRFVIPDGQGLSVSADGGAVTIKSLSVVELKSAWTKVGRRGRDDPQSRIKP